MDRGTRSHPSPWPPQGGPLHTSTTANDQNVVAPLAGTWPPDTTQISLVPTIFAEGKLDEGTRLLIEALEVHTTDVALDIGCGAGFIGLHIARFASTVQMTTPHATLATLHIAR